MNDIPEELRPALPFALVNRVLNPVREQLVSIDSRSAMKLAERTTGLHDFGSGNYRQRLDATINGLNEVDLSTIGRFGARYGLDWTLGNRLRVVEALKQHPEVTEIPITRPIIITGFFRTGTTFLHNVMAADPDNRVGKAWEFCYPVGRPSDPLGDVAWRRRRTNFTLGVNHTLMPDQDVAHHVTTDSYEECFFFLETEMAYLMFIAAFGGWSYAFDMLNWDMAEPFEAHKRLLQVQTARRAEKRWCLKSPWYLWNLDALLKVYPDALIVHTHRNLSKAIGSQASLCARMTAKTVQKLDLEALGDFWVRYSQKGIERAMQVRETLPPEQVYDIRLNDLLSRPVETLKDLYGHFDLEYDESLTERFLNRIAENPTAQMGEHEYDIEEFGLTDARIRAAFAEYCERFGV